GARRYLLRLSDRQVLAHFVDGVEDRLAHRVRQRRPVAALQLVSKPSLGPLERLLNRGPRWVSPGRRHSALKPAYGVERYPSPRRQLLLAQHPKLEAPAVDSNPYRIPCGGAVRFAVRAQ